MSPATYQEDASQFAPEARFPVPLLEERVELVASGLLVLDLTLEVGDFLLVQFLALGSEGVLPFENFLHQAQDLFLRSDVLPGGLEFSEVGRGFPEFRWRQWRALGEVRR